MKEKDKYGPVSGVRERCNWTNYRTVCVSQMSKEVKLEHRAGSREHSPGVEKFAEKAARSWGLDR